MHSTRPTHRRKSFPLVGRALDACPLPNRPVSPGLDGGRLTRRLIDAIAERLGQIGKAVERLGLGEESFLDFPDCAEEIP